MHTLLGHHQDMLVVLLLESVANVQRESIGNHLQ